MTIADVVFTAHVDAVIRRRDFASVAGDETAQQAGADDVAAFEARPEVGERRRGLGHTLLEQCDPVQLSQHL